MKAERPELLFPSRDAFRAWLSENAESSDGVWLVFGKTKAVVTLSAKDALEEALCFGWIDGQINRIDDARYRKYFARRQAKSNWSEKNKKIVKTLYEKKLMTELGEMAIERAKKNGTWATRKSPQITEEQIIAFAEKLSGFIPACENFNNMSPSVRLTYTKGYYSYKTEEARERNFHKIVERLNKNLKPM